MSPATRRRRQLRASRPQIPEANVRQKMVRNLTSIQRKPQKNAGGHESRVSGRASQPDIRGASDVPWTYSAVDRGGHGQRPSRQQKDEANEGLHHIAVVFMRIELYRLRCAVRTIDNVAYEFRTSMVVHSHNIYILSLSTILQIHLLADECLPESWLI